jgi:hypothetical protein
MYICIWFLDKFHLTSSGGEKYPREKILSYL